MTDEECPNCAAPGYQNVGDGTPRICVQCGYDDEHGFLSVCPGGKHPRDSVRRPCCDPCWKRAPIDLPEYPRWRSKRRALTARWDAFARNDLLGLDDALAAWLTDHPVE